MMQYGFNISQVNPSNIVVIGKKHPNPDKTFATNFPWSDHSGPPNKLNMRYDYNTIRIFIQSDIFYKLILSWVECIALLLLVPTAVMLVQAIPRDAAAVGHEAGRG